jgi:hypothetical protein
MANRASRGALRLVGGAVIALLISVLGVTSTPALPAASQATYAFDDEFDGTTLDTNQWTALNRDGDTSNQELQCYLASNVSESGGLLSLLSQLDPAGCAKIGTRYQHSSGAIVWTSSPVSAYAAEEP